MGSSCFLYGLITDKRFSISIARYVDPINYFSNVGGRQCAPTKITILIILSSYVNAHILDQIIIFCPWKSSRRS